MCQHRRTITDLEALLNRHFTHKLSEAVAHKLGKLNKEDNMDKVDKGDKVVNMDKVDKVVKEDKVEIGLSTTRP